MKRKVGLVVLLFLTGFAVSSVAITTEEVVGRMQEKYEGIQNLTADFAQESTSKMLDQTRITKARGKVYFQKPGMMRWEYSTSPRNRWISDGKTLWFYQPEENQVVVEGIDPEQGRLFLAFLLGKGDLQRDFDIHGWGEEVDAGEGGYRVELTPRKPHAMMDRFILTVDPKTWYVEQAEVYDIYGNLTRTHFRRIRVNQELRPDLFTFVIPPGTEVIKNPAPPSP